MEIQWPLALFTVALCAASGAFGGLGVLVLQGKGRRIWLPTLATTLVLMVLGGIASFFHLQHWERIFNGFGHLSSGITQELIGLVVMFIAVAVFFIAARKHDDGDELPKWLGVVALVVGVLMVFVSAHAYGMAARPAWSTVGTYLGFYGGALVMGPALLWTISAIMKDDAAPELPLWTAVGGVVALVCTVAFCILVQSGDYEVLTSYFDPITPTASPVSNVDQVSDVLLGGSAWIFWGLAVVVGTVVPAVAGFVSRKASGGMAVALSAAALACAVVGGIAFRAVFFLLGASSFGIAF